MGCALLLRVPGDPGVSEDRCALLPRVPGDPGGPEGSFLHPF